MSAKRYTVNAASIAELYDELPGEVVNAKDYEALLAMWHERGGKIRMLEIVHNGKQDEIKRLSSLLLEGIRIMEKSHAERGLCPDSEHEWINRVLNRDTTANRGVKP